MAMSSSKTDQLTAVATEAVKTISHSVQSAMNPIDDYDSPDSPSQARTLQYTRRGLKMVGEKSLFDLKEPIWHPDEKSPICDKCRTAFSLLNRRHHCRRCGDVVCGHCCDRTPLTRMGYVDPVLVCHNCVPTCKTEEEFMQHQLKHLLNGGDFHISSNSGFPSPTTVLNLKLSQYHRVINSTPENELFPVNMKHILEVKTLTPAAADQSPTPDQGGRRSGSTSGKMTGLELIIKASAGHDELKLVLTPSSHHRKAAMEWLRALKKALIILHTTK